MKPDRGGSSLLDEAPQSIQKRNVTVGELLSHDQLQWVAMLTHGYLQENGNDREIHSFRDLGISVRGDPESALGSIRKSGSLSEGSKSIPPFVLTSLLRRSGGKVWIRRSDSAEIRSIFNSDFAAIVNANCVDGEFEATSDDGGWYMRFRDDDALVFLAVDKQLLQEIIASSPEHVLPISHSFLYA